MCKGILGGTSIKWSLFTATYWAYPPPDNIPITLLNLLPSESSSYPENSNPKILVAPFGGEYLPYLYNVSALLIDVEWISIKD